MKLRRALLINCLFLAACSRWTYELGDPLGEATRQRAAEVEHLGATLAALGPPHRVARIADGYVLGWEYWRIHEHAVGISLGALGADLLAIDWGRAQLEGEFLLLRFDTEHRLTARAFNTWDERVGGGTALQPSIALVDLVDVEDLLEPLPQHRWGALSLNKLPVTLNRASSPDSGHATFEQRGTPTGAGQRSLEMAD
jgi:hypothetical protein